jgi:hypothetical protein
MHRFDEALEMLRRHREVRVHDVVVSNWKGIYEVYDRDNRAFLRSFHSAEDALEFADEYAKGDSEDELSSLLTYLIEPPPVHGDPLEWGACCSGARERLRRALKVLSRAEALDVLQD